MADYDLQDPYDLARLDADFGDIGENDWEAYIEKAKTHKLSYKNIGALIDAKKKMRSRNFSSTMKKWALSLVSQLEKLDEEDERSRVTQESLAKESDDLPRTHVTLRVAWHDDKWNGHVCRDPKNNVYCGGFNSLLSERIRSRKEKNMALEVEHAGAALNEIDYLPPCFWSANLFGDKAITTQHDNPAAPTLVPIEEVMEPHSMYSWPFAVSFTRTKQEHAESGAYPKNLEQVRIPHFSKKLKEGSSIAFMYAKFSNPLTEEEQQYLVVGAGIVNKKQLPHDIPHFGPDSEIEKIRERPQSNKKYRNFPSMNWAMQFQFDDHSLVRMPYHEYLEHAGQVGGDEGDKSLAKIKVAITEPELNWCFKYVAMDIGDDEAIYILTKMRKALMDCKDDAVVAPEAMQERIEKVEGLLELAWAARSYFPGFVNVARALLGMQKEPKFPLERFWQDFKVQADEPEGMLREMLADPKSQQLSKVYASDLLDLRDRLEQRRLTVDHLLKLCMLDLRPFQFARILSGRLTITSDWIRDFENEVGVSHDTDSLIENPYILHEDYDHWPDSHDDVLGEELDAPIDLFKIDIAYFPDPKYLPRIELQRGMGFADKRRIRALIIRHLRTLEQRGDCFASADQLQEATAAYPLYFEIGGEYTLKNGFFDTLESDYVNHFHEEPRKLDLLSANATRYFYLHEVFEAEKTIERKIRSLLVKEELGARYQALEEYLETSALRLQGKMGSSFEKPEFVLERQELYDSIFKKRFYILTGTAGSGKSYEILNIIAHLQQQGQKCLLLAPTGKAALRLGSEKDFKDIEAYTIDKFIAGVKYRKITQQEVRSYTNVIIDEMSMVDLLKFEKLLSIFSFDEPSFQRLVLVGDPNQLPAIGFGRVLGDLIEFVTTSNEYAGHFIRLESNCRSELSGNKVLDLANGFIQKSEGLPSEMDAQIKKREEHISQGFKIRYWSGKDDLYRQLVEEFDALCALEGIEGDLNQRLNQLLGLTSEGKVVGNVLNVEQFQIISPYQGQFAGASRLNDMIQGEFKKDLDITVQKVFKHADKIIRTRNYYDDKELVLSNGTLGVILDEHRGELAVESRAGIEKYRFDDIRSGEREFFELAYAITVHKSQGSGFDHLFFILPARYGLLNRELVYTALTRTKKSMTLFMQTTEEQKEHLLEAALKRPSSSARQTSLMLDKPYRYYNLEPEPGVFVSSRVELMIYHTLMKKRELLGVDVFSFDYEVKSVVDGKEVPIKTDFTVYTQNGVWYWEHLGLLNQRKYTTEWQKLKTKTYREYGLWDHVLTTEERNGISITKIESLVDLLANGAVVTEDTNNQYSLHHYHLR